MAGERIYLFDIDGTLMRGAGMEHRAALADAIRHHTGLETTVDGIPLHGMLDRDILAEMMRRAECSDDRISGCLEAVMRTAQEIYPPSCPDLRDKVLPGVVETLEMLTREHHQLGLVTGNLTTIGWTKVNRAGIGHHFSFGAFADMGNTRTELARIAWMLAGGKDPRRVTLIGDAPSDIVAARENGFRAVAVATGLTTKAELEALGADIALNGLSQPEDRARLLEP
jgi:phosphoglycolate phosphatase-like HAD superfamily hydrolase